MRVKAWQPPADVFLLGERWFIKLEVAGVHVNDINVSTCGNSVLVKGVRRDLLLNERIFYQSLEIAYSQFERSIKLPFSLEGSNIEWDYKDGMLLIRVETLEGSEVS